MAEPLTLDILKREAAAFVAAESAHGEPTLYGVTDGKTVGTYLEHKFRAHVLAKYSLVIGNSARGIDLPELDVDIKVTSQKQPQSSCPFKSARQKIFGLGYSILLFVYDKTDDHRRRTSNLNILYTIFVEAAVTGDFTMTRRIRELVKDGANREDIVAYMTDRNLPIDEIEAQRIAEDVLRSPPEQGYLTISNALQWRLQYGRVIELANLVPGVFDLAAQPK